MRIVFMGSPAFALPSLKRLAQSRHSVVLVVTQPDRPRGRGRRVGAPPVKEAAESSGIPVMQPEDPNAEEVRGRIEEANADLGVVVAYGQFLKRALRSLFPYGCINVHPSLLPKFRGADPIRWAIYAGEKETGVTTIFVSDKMDAGDIILQRTVRIAEFETFGELSERLAAVGSEVLLETVDAIERNEATRTAQDYEDATYAPKFKPEERRIDWSDAGTAVINRVRAFAPDPGADAEFRGRGLKVLRARVLGGGAGETGPGTVIEVGKDGTLVVATGQGNVAIEEVQPAGRRPMSMLDFINGYHPRVGERFG
ncbi:hypothetical protein AMJ82_01330 [candidate division TA06 bacterium SM23_40]|uniref:Methionyl-tRNA formyltransferase n=1 Tax=candidate division TA06 bacterium SM23_40 TaxID=1703774 RepID=A0A0S8GDT9_UNCT6|nr:MAG: hypothetical protein AMJ82_01330 [candidate division TA06 bacterium SM23_40]